MEIAGGNPNVAVKYLPLMLVGMARQWIDDLPKKSIYNRLDKTIKPYDGTAKPATWLQDYGNTVEIAGGNPSVAIKYLSLMLAGTTRQWIDDLPEKSIYN